jgi:hypothetical protein
VQNPDYVAINYEMIHEPTSEALRVVERITRVGADSLSYQVRYDDPNTWVKPWTVVVPLTTRRGYEIYSYECHEGNYEPPPPSQWQGNTGLLPDDPSFGRRR